MRVSIGNACQPPDSRNKSTNATEIYATDLNDYMPQKRGEPKPL